MFTTGETYRDLGGDYFQRRDPERHTRRLVAQLERLGHHVTLEPAVLDPQRYFPSENAKRRTGSRYPRECDVLQPETGPTPLMPAVPDAGPAGVLGA